MLFLFCKRKQLLLKLGDGKRRIRARNVEHDKRRHGGVVLLHQQAKDCIGEVVVDIVTMKMILEMVEGVFEKNRKPVVLAVYSTIAVATLPAFEFLSRRQVMKRNGNVLEVLVLIDVVEDARNVDANEDIFAGQRGNEGID